MHRIITAALLLCGSLGAPQRAVAQSPESQPAASFTGKGQRQLATTPVKLATVLAHADRHAPSLLVARARLELGQAARASAAPLLPSNPELEVSVGPRMLPSGTSVDVELSLRQQIEIGGQRGLRLDLAQRRQDRLQAALKQARWLVHQRVHAAYDAALMARARVAVADHLRSFSGRLLEISRKRQAAGEVAMLHVRLARGEAARANQRWLRAAHALRAACLNLAEASGWNPGNLPRPSGKLPAVRVAPDLGTLIRRARDRHPGLGSLRAVVREAEARQVLARREALPRPVLGVSYSREAEASGEVIHMVHGSLSLPIPLWRRNQGQRAHARARATVARAHLRALEQSITLRVTRAAAALDAASRRVGGYGAMVLPEFQKNLDLLTRAFGEGKVDILQVMVARGRFLELQQEALDARRDYHQAHAELETMVGDEIWADVEARR